MPSSTAHGRRLMYWSNPCRIGSSRPQSDTWSGTGARQPNGAQVDRVRVGQLGQSIGRHHRAVLEVPAARPRVLDGFDCE